MSAKELTEGLWAVREQGTRAVVGCRAPCERRWAESRRIERKAHTGAGVPRVGPRRMDQRVRRGSESARTKEDRTMALYMLQAAYTPQAWAAMASKPEDREQAARALTERSVRTR